MVSSNNAINNTVGASISGVTNTLTVTNPSNTASSAARETIVVGGGTAADPTINWNVSGVTNWEMGIDNSDSDKWKLSQGTALGTNDTMVAFTGGSVLKPRQPGFLAYRSANVANVTGDGTNYTAIFDVEQFDTASSYDNTTGTFTAPVSGIYNFSCSLMAANVQASNTAMFLDYKINAGLGSETNWRFFQANSANIQTTGIPDLKLCGASGSITISLTAGDTVNAILTVTNGVKTVTFYSDTAGNPGFFFSWFCGYLLG